MFRKMGAKDKRTSVSLYEDLHDIYMYVVPTTLLYISVNICTFQMPEKFLLWG